MRSDAGPRGLSRGALPFHTAQNWEENRLQVSWQASTPARGQPLFWGRIKGVRYLFGVCRAAARWIGVSDVWRYRPSRQRRRTGRPAGCCYPRVRVPRGRNSHEPTWASLTPVPPVRRLARRRIRAPAAMRNWTTPIGRRPAPVPPAGAWPRCTGAPSDSAHHSEEKKVPDTFNSCPEFRLLDPPRRLLE
jgi:hypothetical protein